MLDEEAREDLIERITAIFTNEADAREFNDDPDGYTGEHLPEGTEGADVAGVLPEVGHRTGLDFSNVASTGGGASAAGELSHTYQTIYQQNSFIYAEEGSQVTNIQGNDNAVAQQDIDVDIDYGQGETDELPEDEAPETPEDPTDPVDPLNELPELPGLPEAPETPEEPWDPSDELPEAPEAPEEAPEAPAEAPDPMEGMEV
jgi:hypothetical protein